MDTIYLNGGLCVIEYTSHYECRICGSRENTREIIDKHLKKRHGSDNSDENINVVQVEASLSNTLEAIYVINKKAKKEASLAHQKYKRGKKSESRIHSNRKEALYQVKSKIISKILDESDKIAIHSIEGESYYCFYFSDENGKDWSFHGPVDEFTIETEIDKEDILTNYSVTYKNERSELSAREALEYIKSKHYINANRYISEDKMKKNPFGLSASWSYL